MSLPITAVFAVLFDVPGLLPARASGPRGASRLPARIADNRVPAFSHRVWFQEGTSWLADLGARRLRPR